MTGQVTLVSQDQQEITVDVSVIKQSKIIWQMLQDIGDSSDDPNEQLPIPNVSHAILKKIIDWCE